MEDILEELENLPISEECFNDIMEIVEEIINESPTFGSVKSAVASSIPLRMQKYREAKANPNSTPQDIKRASDRVDKAVAIKGALRKATTSDNYRVGVGIKQAMKNASTEASLSSEEKQRKLEAKRKELDDKAIERQKELQNMWNRQPDHWKERINHPNGFKYSAKLKTNR